METRFLIFYVAHFFAVLFNIVRGIDDEAEKFLLPGDIVPVHYNLRFNTHAETFFEEDRETYIYDGYVSITMVPVRDGVEKIVINSCETLNITACTLTARGSPPIDLGSGSFDPASQKHSFSLKNPLVRSEQVTLTMTFIAEHWVFQAGFYLTRYTENGQTKVMLNTEYQPTFARIAFPCFDEPRYKATYNISVSVPKKAVALGYRPLSNTEQLSVEKNNQHYIYHFKMTPLPISSYLTAVLVSDFHSTPPKYFNSTYLAPKMKEFRTWASPSVIGKGNLSQVAGLALMDIYQRDYKIGYGYDKLDQASLIGYTGGMENWGLIFYWGPQLMFSDSMKMDTVTLIAHELGHQWFGNLVTCHSWSDIWLNEGFATYVEYFGADKIRTPELDTSKWLLPYAFVTEVLQNKAMQEDVPGLSHPLTVDVYDPRDIWNYFDSIEYDKAGSVIRMWTHILGLNAFDKAIQLYLTKNKESLSTPEALLSSFDTVANESRSNLEGRLPGEIFKCWIVQEGYPVVHVRQYNELEYTLRQEVFRYRSKTDYVGTAWTIPITYSTDKCDNFNETHATHWLRENGSELKILLNKPAQWIVVNNQESGYYRVNYDIKNWKKLFKILTNPQTIELIHEINRAQIIDDASNLARSTADNYLSYSFFMDLTTYLENEKGYYPWKAALNNFEYLVRMLSKDGIAYSLFKQHVLRLVQKRYEDLTWFDKPDDSFQDEQLRSQVVSWACKMGHLECLQNVRTILNEYLNQSTRLPDYMTKSMYCSSATDNDVLWKELWEMYLKSDDVIEKKRLVDGLACTRNEKNLKTLLDRSIDENENNGLMIFSSVYNGSPENVNLLLKFVAENFEKIYASYGGFKVFADLMETLARGLATDEEMARMRDLLMSIRGSERPKVRLPKNTISNILEILEINNDWLKKRSDHVSKWLASRYGFKNPSRLPLK